jgi:hypothetical protein
VAVKLTFILTNGCRQKWRASIDTKRSRTLNDERNQYVNGEMFGRHPRRVLLFKYLKQQKTLPRSTLLTSVGVQLTASSEFISAKQSKVHDAFVKDGQACWGRRRGGDFACNVPVLHAADVRHSCWSPASCLSYQYHQ